METVLITGAAGAMGRMLSARLARPGRALRLTDLEAGTGIGAADVRDLDAMVRLSAGADAVVHLGGISTEAPWAGVLDVNVHGTRQVLEAARRNGVGRVILASSNHAVGMYEHRDGLADDAEIRPDTYYGVSKAAMEALGRLYADRFPMSVFALRIGSCFEAPKNTRMLATWLSPDDAARLVEACLTTGVTGFRTIWGVSANTRRWWSAKGGEEIGFHPRDDAEAYAGRVDESPDPDLTRVGGQFCSMPLGGGPPPEVEAPRDGGP